MRILLCFCLFLSACDGGDQSDFFDFNTISDPKIAFCQKVKPVVIFGKATCPYCQRAMAELKVRQFEYRFVELAPNNANKSSAELIAANDELKKMLEKNNIKFESLTTVPQIFFGGTYVGGFDDLDKKLLEPMDKLLGAQNVAAAVKACQ